MQVECHNKHDEILYRNVHAQIVPLKGLFSEESPKRTENLNVLMLGVDSVSRLSFLRHAPDLHRYLSLLVLSEASPTGSQLQTEDEHHSCAVERHTDRR